MVLTQMSKPEQVARITSKVKRRTPGVDSIAVKNLQKQPEDMYDCILHC